MSTFYDDDPVAPPKPPAPPSADPDSFANAGQLAKGWTRFCYRHRTHSVVDVLRPNYFASCVDRGFNRGDEIAALIGEPESARKLNLIVCTRGSIPENRSRVPGGFAGPLQIRRRRRA